MIQIGPQPGPQTQFLASKADIAFLGGGAGGGKSYALLLEPLRHHNNELFRGVIFRRESPQITNPGGLWDESGKLYSLLSAEPKMTTLEWRFPHGAVMKFAHMQYDSDVFSWQGSQFAYLGFDEVTHFSASQFWYMISRLRSDSQVSGYVRATCNPDPDSFVAKLLEWWIGEDGFPILDRSGVLRWFIRDGDDLIWSNSKEELISKYGPQQMPKSLTFIPSLLADNKILMERDPGYLSNLLALPLVDRARLLGGNWKIRPAPGLYFKRSYFEVIEESVLPANRRTVRYWDRASSVQSGNNNPDWTAGVKMSIDDRGMIYVEHVERIQGTPRTVEDTIKNIASSDGHNTTIVIEEDPGQAGKFESSYYVKALAGFTIKTNPVRENKITRAGPFSSQAEHGNVKIVRGKWNDAYISELESFPTKSSKDDQVDASSGAFKMLTADNIGSFSKDGNLAVSNTRANSLNSKRGW